MHRIQYSDDDVGDLDLEGVRGDIFSGYTSLTHCRCEHEILQRDIGPRRSTSIKISVTACSGLSEG